VQLAVLHKVKVISNWMKCLRFAIGSSFSGDSAFALMFVLYNPVSRKDVANKQQQFNRKLADALLPLHQKYMGKSRFCLFGIRRAWISFKFAIKHFDEDCSPVSVMAAVDEPHAAFVKDVARLNMLMKRGADKRDKHSSSLLRKVQTFWSRRNKVSPEAAEQDAEADAPQHFIDEFVSKRDFIAENIDDDARLTMITLLFFNRIADFGEDSACKHYLRKLFDDGAACRAAMRSIYDASQELSQRAVADDASAGFFVSHWRRLHSWVLSGIFGQDMMNINSFYRLNNAQQNELLKTHNFPQADSVNFSATTDDDTVAQSLTQGKAEHVDDAAQYAAGLKSLALGDRVLGSAQLYREQHAAYSASKPISSSSIAVEEHLSQSSVSLESQATSRRLRDLETQLEELKASLISHKNDADAFRTENLELKKSLAAAQQPVTPRLLKKSFTSAVVQAQRAAASTTQARQNDVSVNGEPLAAAQPVTPRMSKKSFTSAVAQAQRAAAATTQARDKDVSGNGEPLAAAQPVTPRLSKKSFTSAVVQARRTAEVKTQAREKDVFGNGDVPPLGKPQLD
jgi:hypothetical protein